MSVHDMPHIVFTTTKLHDAAGYVLQHLQPSQVTANFRCKPKHMQQIKNRLKRKLLQGQRLS